MNNTIGNIALKNKFILAPMAGYSVPSFRRAMAESGAALTVTEMVSVKGLIYSNEKTKLLLKTYPVEEIKCVQLFGSNPKDFLKAAKLPEIHIFDIIDINMGCPVKKVVKNGEGSALMQSPKLAQDIVKALKDLGKTVTVKTRLGIENSDNAVEFALFMQEAGADMITIHARTQIQMYQGKPDYEKFALVKKALSIPAALSGDIVDQDSLLKAKETGADFFMIGRGALYDPDIFLKFLNLPPIGKKAFVDKLLGYMEEDFGPVQAVKIYRKFLPYLLKGIKCSKEKKHSLNFIADINELKYELDSILSNAD